MSWKLLINPFAEQDLEQAKDYYNLQKERLGEEFIFEVSKIISRLRNNPRQFPFEKGIIRKAKVDRFPYLIFYFLNEKIIIVFAVFHASRNPSIWKSRI